MISLSVFESFNIICIPNSILSIVFSSTAFFYVLQYALVISFLFYQSLNIVSHNFVVNLYIVVIIYILAFFFYWFCKFFGYLYNEMAGKVQFFILYILVIFLFVIIAISDMLVLGYLSFLLLLGYVVLLCSYYYNLFIFGLLSMFL